MIQFSGSSEDGKRFVGVGLSAENVRRLQAGDPAIVDLGPHGFEGAQVFIFYGRDESEMEAMVKKHFTVGVPQ